MKPVSTERLDEDLVMIFLRKNFDTKTVRALTYTSWRDGIDVERTAGPTMAFVNDICDALLSARTSPTDGELVERLRHLVSLNEPRNGGPYGGTAAQECMKAMVEAAARLSTQGKRLAELESLVDRLKLEAQIHAGEATTANSTLYEIYQLCSGATGEKGNWNGAEPVRVALSTAEARVAKLEAALKRLSSHWSDGWGLSPSAVKAGVIDRVEQIAKSAISTNEAGK